jgi:trigger factor
LKIETQPIENHQVKITAELDAENFEQYKHRAARQIAKESKIPGFRPGKAPFDVVRRLYGDEMIEKQAVEILIDEAYPKILDEAQIKPGGSGQLQDIISTNPPKFTFIVPLIPEVNLCDYKSMRQDYQYEPLSQEEYDKFINNLRKGTATAEPVDRAVETDDLVYVKINGKLAEPKEGEEPEIVKDRPFQVVVGDDVDIEDAWPFPGFSNELIGLKPEEEKIVIYNYPEESNFAKLRGKEVEFHVKLESNKKLVLPTLNDEFARLVGYDSVTEMEKTIRERLETNKSEEFNQTYTEEFIEKIVQNSEIKYPPTAVEDEIHDVMHSFEHDLADQKMDFEAYLKLRSLGKDEFIETEIKPTAIKRLERSLVIEKIATEEKLQLNQDELKNEVTLTLGQLVNNPSFKKPKNNAEYKQLVDAVSYDAANRLFNKQIMDKLVEIGSGKVQPMETTAVEVEAEKPEEIVEASPSKPKKSRSKKQEA